MTKLAKRIKEERKKNNWSQLNFAVRVDLTRVTISYIENGHSLGPVAIKKLARYFNLTTKEIRKEMKTKYEDNK